MRRPTLTLLAVSLVAGCGMPTPTSTCGPASATVARAIDGDTIELADGKKVRMLLVDTPESTNGKTDCYGHEAAQFTSDKVLGKTVQLTYDDASCTDRYGR
ncbi:MAG: thermonuclease family protein, partial [Archangium sp.]|nr:thermonuclease family protein [Archangium sp.]